MPSIVLLKNSIISHVQRLPTGVVALKDHVGQAILTIGPEGRIGDPQGEPFDLSRAKEDAAPSQMGSGRYDVQRYNSCEVSPFGFCVGDTETDESECVFCGEPEERK